MEINFPTVEALEAELQRENRKSRRRKTFRNIIIVLIILAAVLTASTRYLTPFIRIHGDSSEPALKDGQLVICLKGAGLSRGDAVAFYQSGIVIIKRVIAVPGDAVQLGPEGAIVVNGEEVRSRYHLEGEGVSAESSMQMELEEGKYLLIGDRKIVKADSENLEVSIVGDDVIIGKIIILVWPLEDFGKVD